MPWCQELSDSISTRASTIESDGFLGRDEIGMYWACIPSGKDCYIAMENGPVETASFPMNSMVDLSILKRLPESFFGQLGNLGSPDDRKTRLDRCGWIFHDLGGFMEPGSFDKRALQKRQIFDIKT